MHRSRRLARLLETGGLSLHAHIGRFLGVSFTAQCWLAAALSALALFIAGALDQTFVLPGRDVGLLEHPGIWSFVALQIALPLVVADSLRRLARARLKLASLAPPTSKFADVIERPLIQWARLRTPSGRALGALVYGAGFAAFVWNSYQNQFPNVLVEFDFWDSVHYPVGYWVTRFYKLFLFAWFLPYLIMCQAGVIATSLSLVRQARLAGRLRLQPFDADGVGGLGFVAPLVSTPVIVALLISAIPLAAAFHVHRALDATPVLGAATVLALCVGAYAVPTLYLRADIVALKSQLVAELRNIQQSFYARIIGRSKAEPVSLEEANHALDYFDKVCARIGSVSNFPHLRRVSNALGFALTPTLISILTKLYEEFSPLLRSHLEQR